MLFEIAVELVTEEENRGASALLYAFQWTVDSAPSVVGSVILR